MDINSSSNMSKKNINSNNINNMSKKTRKKSSKENWDNVLNTPLWTSPKRNSNNNDSKADPFGSSLGSASKYIERSLFDLDELISQRKKELNSIRQQSSRLDDTFKINSNSSSNGNNKSIKTKSTEKSGSSGSKRLKSIKSDDYNNIDNILTSPSIDNGNMNAVGFTDYTPMTSSSSNAPSTNPTPDALFTSSVETSPTDSPLMVKISRFALNDLHNREKIITQQLKEANSRVNYLELCNSDKDIHIESLTVALTEIQTIKDEMETEAAIKINKFKEEISLLKSHLKSRDEDYYRMHAEVNSNNSTSYEMEAQLLAFRQQIEELQETIKENEELHEKYAALEAKVKENEELHKKYAALEARLLAKDDDLNKKLLESQNTIDEYKHREKEIKDLFDITAIKVEELKAKADHYHKLCKEYKKKMRYFENEVRSYEKSLNEAETRASAAVNKLIEIETKHLQEKTNKADKKDDDDDDDDDEVLLLTKKVKDAEDACLLFKGLYEEAVRENERWVAKVQQLEATVLMLDGEKKVLEGSIFELEVTIAKSEQEYEVTKEAAKDLAKVTASLEKAKKKNKELKAGLATMANAHDSTIGTNSTLLNQVLALQDTIEAKDEQINNLNIKIQAISQEEEEMAEVFLLRDKELEQLKISYDERERDLDQLQCALQQAEDRIESLEDELDGILMEKLNSTNSNTPTSNTSPNPFATPYNKHNDSNPNTNDKNNSNNGEEYFYVDDDQDIDETLLLVNEAEDAFKKGNLHLAVKKYKEAGLKGNQSLQPFQSFLKFLHQYYQYYQYYDHLGIQSIQRGKDDDKETKKQLKELVNRCLQNAEGINNQISNTDSPRNSPRNSPKKTISSDSNQSLSNDTDQSATEYNWIKPLVIVTAIGTIFMIGIFFALISYFEANRPNMKPTYIWPHDITDIDDL